MDEILNKPIPTITKEQAPFWEGANIGKLILQFCSNCNVYQHYPRIVCRNCQGHNLTWNESKGMGIIYTYSTVYRSPGPFMEDVPYVTALVELEEGVRIYTRIVNCNFNEIFIGMKVKAVFDKEVNRNTYIYFQPIQGN